MNISKRQIEVLDLVKLGKTNDEIAYDLFVSANTIKIHVQTLLGELGASNRAHAVYIGLKKGIIK